MIPMPPDVECKSKNTVRKQSQTRKCGKIS